MEGDILQLEAVLDKPVWKPPGIYDLSKLAEGNPLWHEFSSYELLEVINVLLLRTD